MPRISAGVRSARFKKYGPQARTVFRNANIPDRLRDEFGFLSVISDRDGFAALIESTYPRGSGEYVYIMSAVDLVRHSHWGRRRHSGEREFKHLLRCLLILWIFCGVRAPYRLVAMALHDLHETFRNKWPLERIRLLFGADAEMHVRLLSKRKERRGISKRENERHYYEVQLVGAPREVIEEKGVDALDNLMTLWARSTKRMGRKIDDIVRYLLPLLHKHKLDALRHAIVLVLWTIRHKLRNGIPFAH